MVQLTVAFEAIDETRDLLTALYMMADSIADDSPRVAFKRVIEHAESSLDAALVAIQGEKSR